MRRVTGSFVAAIGAFPKWRPEPEPGHFSSEAIRLNLMSSDAFLTETLGWKLHAAALARPI